MYATSWQETTACSNTVCPDGLCGVCALPTESQRGCITIADIALAWQVLVTTPMPWLAAMTKNLPMMIRACEPRVDLVTDHLHLVVCSDMSMHHWHIPMNPSEACRSQVHCTGGGSEQTTVGRCTSSSSTSVEQLCCVHYMQCILTGIPAPSAATICHAIPAVHRWVVAFSHPLQA